MTSTPALLAISIESISFVPQSTVIMSFTPSLIAFSIAFLPMPYPSLNLFATEYVMFVAPIFLRKEKSRDVDVTPSTS